MNFFKRRKAAVPPVPPERSPSSSMPSTSAARATSTPAPARPSYDDPILYSGGTYDSWPSRHGSGR